MTVLSRRQMLRLLPAAALTVAGCQVEAGLSSPAQLTATITAQQIQPTLRPSTPAPLPTPSPQPTPVPDVGWLATIQGGDLWVQQLPNGKARRLTRDGRNAEPRWSPSRQWLSFRKDEQIWVIQADGSQARSVVTGIAAQAVWSPGADLLASVQDGKLIIEAADGGNRRQAPPPAAAPDALVHRLAWSSDGQSLAVELWRKAGESRELPLGLGHAPADSNAAITLVYKPSDPEQTQPYLVGWSPDAKHLLFWRGQALSASLTADGMPVLAAPVAGGEPIDLKIVTLMEPDYIAWSPDGRQLATVDGAGRETWRNKAIAVGTLADGLQRRTEPDQATLDPAWSPDGGQIAFCASPATESSDQGQALGQRRIWAMAPDGSGKRSLTSDPAYRDERPRWSTDGSHLLIARLEGERAQLWLMRADGAEPRQVVDELTPSPGGAGNYGRLDWGRLYDWWPGAPATPKTTIAATPGAPTPTPPGVSESR